VLEKPLKGVRDQDIYHAKIKLNYHCQCYPKSNPPYREKSNPQIFFTKRIDVNNSLRRSNKDLKLYIDYIIDFLIINKKFKEQNDRY